MLLEKLASNIYILTSMTDQFEKLESNFKKLGFDGKSIKNAVNHIKLWLLHPEFEIYRPQIDYLIKSKEYAELFDAFYQIIPFGTAGRRGKVGIGYNRINQWTIVATAQGHAQYLSKKYGKEASSKGIVIAYDVRQYANDKIYNNYLQNPIWGITSRKLAEIAATVYSQNDIKVHFFHDVRSTPQLSFTIRKLEAVSGINITASHNPPDYNGIKVYDHLGGQLIPPNDQELINEINSNVNVYELKWNDFETERQKGLIDTVSTKTEHEYISAVKRISLSRNREIKIVYSPLHGTGKTSVYKVLKNMGFDVHLEPEGSIPSGQFETVPAHKPDPANLAVYWNSINYADSIDAELIVTTDPDADRVGVMAKNKLGKWVFIDGNELCVLLTYFVIEKNKKLNNLNNNSTVVSTIPVTRLLRKICKSYDVRIKDDLFPGFKYIVEVMNELEKKSEIQNFLLGMEDTHGHIVGSYARDKDACAGAILLSQFAGELKKNKLTLIDALEGIYRKFGYHKLATTQINFEFSYEKSKLEKAFKYFRKHKEDSFDKYKVKKFIDHLERETIKSDTDASSRDMIEFRFEPFDEFEFFRISMRPSGTEPIVKIYIELGTSKNLEEFDKLEKKSSKMLKELSEYFVKYTKDLMENAKLSKDIVYLDQPVVKSSR